MNFVLIKLLMQNNVDEAVEKLRAQGIEALGIVCHVSNEQQRKNLIGKTVQVTTLLVVLSLLKEDRISNQILMIYLQKYGKIDVVVSNAAANPSVEAILHTQESVLDKLWEVNVKASILLLKVKCVCFYHRNILHVHKSIAK